MGASLKGHLEAYNNECKLLFPEERINFKGLKVLDYDCGQRGPWVRGWMFRSANVPGMWSLTEKSHNGHHYHILSRID